MKQEVLESMSALLTSFPFYASILYDKLDLQYDDDVPTAMTNGKVIKVGPWFCGLPIKERIFVLAHEIMHCVFMHPGRAKLWTDMGIGPDMKPFSFKRWNMAGDYIINATLVEDNTGTMPNGGLINPSKYDSTSLCDEVYKDMEEDDEENFDDHEVGGEAPDETEKVDMDRAVKAAASAARAQGKLPAGLAKLVDGLLNPKVPWTELIARQMLSSIGEPEPDWNKPNRRRMAIGAVSNVMQPILPSVRQYGCGTIVMQIDTSGSVSPAEVAQYLSEMKALVETCGPDHVYLLWVDAEVAHVDHMEDLSEMDGIIERTLKDGAPGGGGTDMREGFKYCLEWGVDPDMMITLTDGYTGWPETCEWPHITAVSTEGQDGAPFGSTVHVDIGE